VGTDMGSSAAPAPTNSPSLRDATYRPGAEFPSCELQPLQFTTEGCAAIGATGSQLLESLRASYRCGLINSANHAAAGQR
jgi:hypothetical protein